MQDINQHFEQLRRLLVKLEYPHPVDKDRICDGVTTELLPLLHHGLLSYSKLLATFISDAGYSLYRQNDLKFTEGIYKLLRKEFKHNPVLQCQQFLTGKGFAKRKIQFVVTCLKLALAKHHELHKAQKQKSASKIAWKETNLAKKVERVIKQPPHTANTTTTTTAAAATKKPPKMIKKKMIQKVATTTVTKTPKTIVASNACVEQVSAADIMNDSLTADEIRHELPKPITIQRHQQHACDDIDEDGDGDDDDDGEVSNDEHESHETEEKATELHDEEEAEVEVEVETYQSIQIPQHQYDMQLIPEYDPNKHSTNDHDDSGGGGGSGDQKECEQQLQQQQQHAEYDAARLDAYGSLMDIQSDDEEEEEEEDTHTQQQPQIVRVTSMSESHGMQVFAAQNSRNNNDDDDDGDRDENNSGTEEENDGDGDGDQNYTHNDDDVDDEDDDDKDQDGDDDAKKHDQDEEEAEQKSSSSPSDPMTAILMAKMEKMIKTATSTIHARLDLMEYRLRSLEQQQGQSKANGNGAGIVTGTGSSTATSSNGHSLPSHISPISAPKSAPAPAPATVPAFVSRSRSPSVSNSVQIVKKTAAAVKTGNMESFTESTIGSTSMPNSLTPMAPIRAHKTTAVISSTVQTYAQAHKTRNRFPMTATSPFLPPQPQPQMTAMNSGGGFQFISAYNPMTTVLRYPQSQNSSTPGSTSSNGVRIQTPSVGMTTDSDVRENEHERDNSGGGGSGGSVAVSRYDGNHEVENTADFIADLRKMLHSTDTLLKNNREKSRLYDSNV